MLPEVPPFVLLGLALTDCTGPAAPAAHAPSVPMVDTRPTAAEIAPVPRAGRAGVQPKPEPEPPPFAWSSDVDAALSQTRSDGKPTFVFFTAAWATSCLELERKTFAELALQRELAARFHPVRIDATNDEDLTTKSLLTRFKIEGLPTLLILNGREDEKLRMQEALTAQQLMRELESR